ncbi:MAG: hypothetical protein M1812_006293, partial [Candelaria pacifica]
IYGEIGPGERIALSKLSVQNLEKTGRPLRIAIDISIWSFQTQASKGGKNPALRTLYYRLLRLLSFSIQPLFVFDGPNKPPVKRNVRTGQHAPSWPEYVTKQLLKYFGFPYHIAPGEAEAECALLQQHGVVDAVLSEDVDTLMFGCGMSMRNWSGEVNKSPSHVNVYYADKTKQGKAGLDREGMVLVALLSGGDYVTEGVPGCGIKIACEAARAGFGKELCALSRKEATGRRLWRERLAHEFNTNENRYFKTVHKAIKIPSNFPDKVILGYYTHPVVSPLETVEKLRAELLWDQEIDIPGLRKFAAEAFDWTYKSGAQKFIRCLAPALLVHKLRIRNDDEATTTEAQVPITAICGKRQHMSNDGEPEIRVIYVPADIVGIDLEAEDLDPQYNQDSETSDDEAVLLGQNDEVPNAPGSPTKRRAPSTYDPTQPQKEWVLETFVKLGAPLMVEDWEESQRNPHKYLAAKGKAKKAAVKRKPVKKVNANGGMKHGALDSFVKVGKPGIQATRKPLSTKLQEVGDLSTDDELPPLFLAPSITKTMPSPKRLMSPLSTPSVSRTASVYPSIMSRKPTKAPTGPDLIDLSSPSRNKADTGLIYHRSSELELKLIQTEIITPTKPRRPNKLCDKSQTSPNRPATPSSRTLARNPWTLSQRPPDTLNVKLPHGARYSALGIYGPTNTSSDIGGSSDVDDNDNGLQSPPSSPSGPAQFRKHDRPLSASSLSSAHDQSLPEDRLRTPLDEEHDPVEPAASLPTPPSRPMITPTLGKKSMPKESTERKVSRQLDLDKARTAESESLASNNDELPSSDVAPRPSIINLLSSSPPENDSHNPLSTPTKPPQNPHSKPQPLKPKKTKRRIVLRQSQEGAWKLVEEEEDEERDRSVSARGRGRIRRRGWRQSQVEVLYMTEGG